MANGSHSDSGGDHIRPCRAEEGCDCGSENVSSCVACGEVDYETPAPDGRVMARERWMGNVAYDAQWEETETAKESGEEAKLCDGEEEGNAAVGYETRIGHHAAAGSGIYGECESENESCGERESDVCAGVESEAVENGEVRQPSVRDSAWIGWNRRLARTPPLIPQPLSLVLSP